MKWRAVRPLSAVVAEGKGRPSGADLTLFKAMGMGISDLALGIEYPARGRPSSTSAANFRIRNLPNCPPEGGSRK